MYSRVAEKAVFFFFFFLPETNLRFADSRAFLAANKKSTRGGEREGLVCLDFLVSTANEVESVESLMRLVALWDNYRSMALSWQTQQRLGINYYQVT